MDRMGRKHESRDRGGERALHQTPDRVREQRGHQGVKEDVAKVIARGVEAPQEVVQPERNHTYWAVRLVGPAVGKGRPPEVVKQQVPDRSLWLQVRVLLDGTTKTDNTNMV
jgi:hypothetical protein